MLGIRMGWIYTKHDLDVIYWHSPFFYFCRNLLYSLPGKTPQFSILRFSHEAAHFCNVAGKAVKHTALCHSTVNQSLSLVLRAIRSAERLVRFGLDLFENYPNDKKWYWQTQTQQWVQRHSKAKKKKGHWLSQKHLNTLGILKHNSHPGQPHLTQNVTMLVEKLRIRGNPRAKSIVILLSMK